MVDPVSLVSSVFRSFADKPSSARAHRLPTSLLSDNVPAVGTGVAGRSSGGAVFPATRSGAGTTSPMRGPPSGSGVVIIGISPRSCRVELLPLCCRDRATSDPGVIVLLVPVVALLTIDELRRSIPSGRRTRSLSRFPFVFFSAAFSCDMDWKIARLE